MIFKDLDLDKFRLDISQLEYDRLWLYLSEDERSRANNFKREYLKRNFVAARGYLRVLLAQRLGCEPHQIKFSYGDRGKPYLEGINSGVYFNLAHSQDLAIYAICGDREVGLDLEYINPKCDFLSISKRYFLPLEHEIIHRIHGLGDRHQDLARLAFYRAWTLKEAYGKATGQGITNILDRIDISPLLESPVGETLAIEGWVLKLLSTELALNSSYAAALCVQII